MMLIDRVDHVLMLIELVAVGELTLRKRVSGVGLRSDGGHPGEVCDVFGVEVVIYVEQKAFESNLC